MPQMILWFISSAVKHIFSRLQSSVESLKHCPLLKRTYCFLLRLCSAETLLCWDFALLRLFSAETLLLWDFALLRLCSAETLLCWDFPLMRLWSAKVFTLLRLYASLNPHLLRSKSAETLISSASWNSSVVAEFAAFSNLTFYLYYDLLFSWHSYCWVS